VSGVGRKGADMAVTIWGDAEDWDISRAR
jgi:hypothetical protein